MKDLFNRIVVDLSAQRFTRFPESKLGKFKKQLTPFYTISYTFAMLRRLICLPGANRFVRLSLNPLYRSSFSPSLQFPRYFSEIAIYKGRQPSFESAEDVYKDLMNLIAEQVRWESLDQETQKAYLRYIKSLPQSSILAKDKKDYSKAKEAFYVHFRMALENMTEGFVVNRDFAGFPDLTMDIALYHEGDLLGFVEFDEPSHFSDGTLLPYHKLKETLYGLKYFDNVGLCRIDIHRILDPRDRDETVLKTIGQLMEVQEEKAGSERNNT